MGEVFRAEDLKLGRQVAIKLLSASRSGKDDIARERFSREARSASLLNHPNIVTIYSIDRWEESDFIVMEYIEGETLGSILERGPLDFGMALDVGVQVADALAAAHLMGVVHRDIKPDNILITARGQAKILDFGLAKMSHSPDDLAAAERNRNLTATGTVMGTVSYMSPEQTRGEDLNSQTDVFSLGSVLYEAATGKKPFQTDSIILTMHEIASAIPPRPSFHRQEIPAEFDELIDRALTKDKDQRCTARELAGSINELRGQTSGSHSGYISGAVTHRPQTRYTRSGDVNIAYQVIGSGPRDLVFVMGWVSHLEYFWEEPSFARFLKRLASFSRLILFDKRGTGLSDRLTELPTLEQRMDDVRAVMDAVGSRKAVLCGVSEGGPMCNLFAATYPERTIALVMIGTYAKRIWDPEYPWAPTAEQREKFLEEIEHKWGGPVGIYERAPSLAHDVRFREWWATYLRMGCSPGAAVALTRMNAEIDVRHILPSIRVPALILHRTGDRCIKVEEGRYLAERIPAARFVELHGEDHLPFVGDQEEILVEIETYLSSLQQQPEPDRVLVTLLSANISPSSGPDVDPNDSRALEQFISLVRKEMARFRGREIRSVPQRYLATFDGPARAIRSACTMSALAQQLKIEVRIGLHTGECDLVGERVQGQAVDIAAGIAARANPGEVLVSGTVKDLVAGSGISFEDRGTFTLDPTGGDRRLFSATV
jgi:pimeloyl-ACP methyl ester carboxylesterase/predicted Ser/Thr protein kinase